MDDRPAPDENEVEVTPRMMEEFEDLFDRWRREGQNWETLEFGGTGNLERLAQLALVWSRQRAA